MGSGKSKLIRHLINYYSNPEVYSEKKLLPIFTTYKNLLDNFEGNVELLIKNLLGKELINELNKPNILLLIDAVDEKDLPPDQLVQNFEKIINNIEEMKNVTAIVTSRYLKEFDQALGETGLIFRYDIQPLSFSKTIKFLTTICTKLNIATRIIQDIKKSSLFKVLPRNPISAILLAKLLQDNTKELPSNMTELYSKYIELTLGRWDIEKGLQSQKEYQTMDNIMMHFAEYMITNEMPAIAISEAKQMFDDYLKARNLDINPDNLFQKMVKRCEIIMTDNESGTLSFKHRTFTEFFYAKLLSEERKLKIDERAFEPYWMNTFFFYLGILKDCPEILKEISDMEPKSEPKRWLKVSNMSNYFLAAYTSPYDVITKGLIKTMLEAASLYNDISQGKIKSFFSILPKMHLLCLMQILIRQGYSYDFLKKAIEEAALRINDGNYDDELKSYAIFFLNVAYIDTTSKESLDFLLKERIGKLPLDLTLAVEHEADDMKTRTALLKKQEKHFKKITKGNKSLISQIKLLYEKPIKLITKANKHDSP